MGQYIKATAPKHWNRNPQWTNMPIVNAGDNKMYGLYAVYPQLENEITLRFTTGSNVEVDWGDGNSSSIPSVTDTTHTYVYSGLTGTVFQDEGGYDYKTVMVEIIFSSTTLVYISRSGTGDETNASSKWLDIIIDNSSMTNFLVSESRKTTFLERLIVLNNSFAGNMQNGRNYLESLKVMEYDYSTTTSANSMLTSLGDARDSNGDPIDFTMNSASTNVSCFFYSTISKLGDLSFTSSSSIRRLLFNNFNISSIGEINIPSVTDMSQTFYECRNLRKVGTFTTSSSLTTINSAFRTCIKLEDIEITDCSGITDATNAFVFTTSLKNVILTGMTATFTVAGNQMDATAIDALFTSLGTTVGGTVTVTDNPGASTCDTTIATAKSWTVVT